MPSLKDQEIKDLLEAIANGVVTTAGSVGYQQVCDAVPAIQTKVREDPKYRDLFIAWWAKYKQKIHGRAWKKSPKRTDPEATDPNGDTKKKRRRTASLKHAGGQDYYELLGVSREAKDDELTRAYRQTAIRWHPDKHVGKAETEQKDAADHFQMAAEAFDVLNDAETRTVYDRYGEEGLKAGGPPPAPPETKQRHDVPPGYFGAGFGKYSPHGAGYDYAGDPHELLADRVRAIHLRQRSLEENPFEGVGGLEETVFGGGAQGYYSGSQRHGRSHVPQRVCGVPCTLEDLYHGRTRQMKITRKSLSDGRPTTKILELHIRRGFKAGTRITFSGEGDEIEKGLFEDVVFVIRELKHDRFVREGDNLFYEIRIPLVDALCGFSRDIKMLDNDDRFQQIHQKGPVTSNTTRILSGEGMPITKTPDKKGDFIVSFAIDFPTHELSIEQKEQIRQALAVSEASTTTSTAGVEEVYSTQEEIHQI